MKKTSRPIADMVFPKAPLRVVGRRHRLRRVSRMAASRSSRSPIARRKGSLWARNTRSSSCLAIGQTLRECETEMTPLERELES
ncbi:hypothetical protein D3C80_837060 [compost metagenome]